MRTATIYKHTFYPIKALLLSMFMVWHLNPRCNAQSNAILIQMDNDYLTDQYYTAGLSIQYFRSFKSQKPTTSKQFIIGYDFQIYTPSIYDEESFVDMTQDRPFAGGHFLRSGIRFTSASNKVQDFAIRTGFVGPQAKAKEIQKFFHTTFGFDPEITGWENQISDQWVVNFDYRWLKEWRLNEDVGLSTSSAVELGMMENSFRQSINFRIGQFKEINSSSWLSPKFASTESFIRESYLNVGIGVQYIGSNIFLDGSITNPFDPPFNIDPVSIVFSGSLGIYIGTPKFNFALDTVFLDEKLKRGRDISISH